MGRRSSATCRHSRGFFRSPRSSTDRWSTYLRAHNEAAAVFDDIWYWALAQAHSTEVDFLLRRGREYLAIEVKARPRVSAAELVGLRAIGHLGGLVRRILLYLGSRRLRTDDGIDIWPVAAWLDAVAEGRLWP